jgi:1-acyl-sn-glycerol-3-phosphate acyltransferase
MKPREAALSYPLWPIGRTIGFTVGTLFFDYRMHKVNRVPQHGGLVIACNHQSYFDPVIAGIGFRKPIHFMARDTLFKNPIFGFIIRSLNAFPVKRGRSDVEALEEAHRRLKGGGRVLVFPEGTRSVTGELGRIRKGIIRIANRADVPILPVMIEGAHRAWPKGSVVPKKSTISVMYGEVYRPDPDPENMLAEADRLKEKMLDLQRQLRALPEQQKYWKMGRENSTVESPDC